MSIGIATLGKFSPMHIITKEVPKTVAVTGAGTPLNISKKKLDEFLNISITSFDEEDKGMPKIKITKVD